MKRVHWKVGIGAALAASALGAGALWAQSASHPSEPHSELVRRPRLKTQAPLSTEALAQRVAAKSRVLVGTPILFEYDSGLTRHLDLDDNGSTEDNGDRSIFQGTVWLSDRSGRKISNIGRFSSIYDYLDLSGESTGTDLSVTTDILIYNSGQIRAGGFWNVEDGNGDPSLSIEGATGANSARRYKDGQLVFLGKVADGQELFFLAR